MIYPYGYPYISPYDSTYDTFGTLRLTEGEEQQVLTEPLDIDLVKTHLRLSLEDDSDDVLLNTYIIAARYQAEIFQGRDLIRKQYDLSYDYWPAYRMRLKSPTRSVDLVQYKDLSGAVTPMVEGADYVTDLQKEPGLITPPWNRSWPAFTPYASSAILIRFTSGYDADSQWWSGGPGSLVKAGMLLLISAWYEQRLPFATGLASVNEYPFAITNCLSNGQLKRAR